MGETTTAVVESTGGDVVHGSGDSVAGDVVPAAVGARSVGTQSTASDRRYG